MKHPKAPSAASFAGRSLHCRAGLLALLAMLCMAVGSLSASTIGYWRFEDGEFLTDSSGNELSLTSGGDTAQASIPETGAGSDFFDPIPQTGAGNEHMANVPNGSSDLLQTASGFDSDAWGTRETFTLEMMVNISARSGSSGSFLAGHFEATGNNRAWALYFPGSSELNLILNPSGGSGTNEFVESGFNLALDTDYYLGVSVDLSAAAAADRFVTFYLQDLTNEGELQSATFNDIATSILYNNTDSPRHLAFGSQSGGGSSHQIGGHYDEIRLSDTVLAENQLLAVPEPATISLMLLAFGVAGIFNYRKRTGGR